MTQDFRRDVGGAPAGRLGSSDLERAFAGYSMTPPLGLLRAG